MNKNRNHGNHLFFPLRVIRKAIKGQVLQRNRQLSSPHNLSTRNTVTFSTLVLIAFLLSYLCTSFNLPNIFRLSCCPCPSQNPLEPSSRRFSLFSSFFSARPRKRKKKKIYIYTFTSVVPPRRNLKLMVNYIRPATEPRTSRGWVFFSFAARAATWLVAADPWRGNEQRAFGLCPSELCIYCYRYAEASSSWRWKRATRAERTARGCTIARPLSFPWDRVQWTDSRANEARFAGINRNGRKYRVFRIEFVG